MARANASTTAVDSNTCSDCRRKESTVITKNNQTGGTQTQTLTLTQLTQFYTLSSMFAYLEKPAQTIVYFVHLFGEALQLRSELLILSLELLVL